VQAANFILQVIERRSAMSLSAHPALVLNADFRPMSYFPLSLLSWQDAIHAVFSERVSVVAEYDIWVRSPSTRIRLPSVVALRKFQPAARRVTFTRSNVFLRDRFTCQYCGGAFATERLTFDHVVPRVRGGRTAWTNVVTACEPCNLRKGHRIPRESGIYPMRAPHEPAAFELQENGRAFPPNFLHDSWRDYLYWDTELDPN
jgi:5-methylcytosine-specific restriction endonuclease McrA